MHIRRGRVVAALTRIPRRRSVQKSEVFEGEGEKNNWDRVLESEEHKEHIARIEEERRIEQDARSKLHRDLVDISSSYEEEIRALKTRVAVLEHEKESTEEQLTELTSRLNSEDAIADYAEVMKKGRTRASRRRSSFVNGVLAELSRAIHKVEVLSHQHKILSRKHEDTVRTLEEELKNVTKERAEIEAGLIAQIDNLENENSKLDRQLRYKNDEIETLKMTTTSVAATRDAMKREMDDMQAKMSKNNELTWKLKTAEEMITILQQVNEANDRVIEKLYCEMGSGSAAVNRGHAHFLTA